MKKQKGQIKQKLKTAKNNEKLKKDTQIIEKKNVENNLNNETLNSENLDTDEKTKAIEILEKIENFFLNILDKIKLKKIADIYRNHLEGMRYLVFGALATVINLAVKFLLLFTILDASNEFQLQTAVIISWIVACAFAYFTNRVLVFKSESDKILKEIISFVTARVITLGMEMVIMFFFVTFLGLDSNLWVAVWSVFAQVVVILSNYVFSKLIIFKKDKEA